MKKYYVNVYVSLYADSPEVAKREIIRCLNTGQGHIHGFELGQVKTHNTKADYPLPCGCEINQTCSQCIEDEQ